VASSQRKLRRIQALIDAEFRQLIEQGIAELSIKPCDPKITAFNYCGRLELDCAMVTGPSGPLEPEEIAHQRIALLLNGLSPAQEKK